MVNKIKKENKKVTKITSKKIGEKLPTPMFYGVSEMTNVKPKYLNDLYTPETVRLIADSYWLHSDKFFNIRFGKLIMKSVAGNIDYSIECSNNWCDMPKLIETNKYALLDALKLLDFKLLRIRAHADDLDDNKGYIIFYNGKVNKNNYFNEEIEFKYNLKDRIVRLIKFKNKKYHIRLFKANSISILLRKMKCMDVCLVNNQIDMLK